MAGRHHHGRGRGRRAIAVLGAGVAIAGAGAIAAAGLGAEVAELERDRVRAGVVDLRDAYRAALRRAQRAPRLLGVPRRKLDAIAECESHGDPRAVSADGSYRGKYQFDRGTWKSNGGRGDPAKAPELEQDLRAAALYKAAGSSPWPNCG